MVEIHTIWVPTGWSIEQVWETIQHDEKLPDTASIDDGRWIKVYVDNGKIVYVE